MKSIPQTKPRRSPLKRQSDLDIHTPPPPFREWIKGHRELLRLTLDDFSIRAGIPTVRLENFEAGVDLPDADDISKLASGLLPPTQDEDLVRAMIRGYVRRMAMQIVTRDAAICRNICSALVQ